MPVFSMKSQKLLSQCHPILVSLFTYVIKYKDCTVICGYRSEEEQNEAYRTGHSKLMFPHSKHNKYPSLAVDVIPCPIDWKNKEAFIAFGNFVLGVATTLGIQIIWGGNWNSFFDAAHFEIKEIGNG